MNIDSMQSFFAVTGFLFCIIVFGIGLRVIGAAAWLGYQAVDFRLKTMTKRVAELRENQPIEIGHRKVS